MFGHMINEIVESDGSGSNDKSTNSVRNGKQNEKSGLKSQDLKKRKSETNKSDDELLNKKSKLISFSDQIRNESIPEDFKSNVLTATQQKGKKILMNLFFSNTIIADMNFFF